MSLKTLKEWFWDFISSGLSKKHEIEALRRTLMLNLTLLFSMATLLILAPIASYQGNYQLAFVDFSCSIVLLLFLILLRKTKNYRLFSIMGVSVGFLLYCFLLISGGSSNSGYVWSFTFPIISVFLLGEKNGSRIAWCLLLVMLTVFFFDKHFSFVAKYDFNVRVRSVSAYLIIFLFSFVMEKSRGMVQEGLNNSTKAVEKVVKELEESNAEKENLIKELRNTMEEIKTLKGIIPICSHCKKIRDDKGYWDRVENYISEHSMAKFSHGICPECAEKNYPHEDDDGDFD